MPDINALDPSALMSAPVAQWLALQRAKNTAEGIGDDNLLDRVFPRGDPYYAPPPAPAGVRPIWSPGNPVGTSVLHDTYAGMPSPDVSPVIGAYGAHPVTAAMRANALNIASMAAQFGPADMASIRAFHGSPYDFNAFDTSKIGTGEGAQAYGHGLYFAENEGVARSYRDQLAPNVVNWKGQSASPSEAANGIVSHMIDTGEHLETPFNSANLVTDWVRSGQTPEQITTRINRGDWDAQSKKELLLANEFAAAHLQPSSGKTYEVSLNADPEHFLDWDKPLSEQSQHVQDALSPEKLGLKPAGPLGEKGWYGYVDETGRLVGRAMTRSHPDTVFNPSELGMSIYRGAGSWSDPVATAQRLRDAGIPGIRYLDQGSRIDPARAEMLRQTLANLQARNASAGAIKSVTDELDRVSNPTHNYVIFDPKTIEILRKYGIAGLIAGGGAAATGTSSQNQQ